jgi:hypothetical protein
MKPVNYTRPVKASLAIDEETKEPVISRPEDSFIMEDTHTKG